MSYAGMAVATEVSHRRRTASSIIPKLCRNMEAGAISACGIRRQNEDAVLCEPGLGLYGVSDGMGGYEGGATASRLAVQAVTDHFERVQKAHATGPVAPASDLPLDESMVDVAFRQAHGLVGHHRRGKLSKMGATLALLYLREDHALVGHVGDTRVYQLSDGTLTQLTRDHSMYEKLIDQGVQDLPPVERFPHAHIITRALGKKEDSGRPELKRVARKPGDAFLLCSDGLWGSLSAEKLQRGLLARDTPDDACAALVEAALDAGSKDNVTALIVRPRS